SDNRTMTKTEPPKWLLAFWKEIDDKTFGKGFDCSQFVRELCYAGRLGFSAAARPQRTGLPGICCHTMGPYLLDRALFLTATSSPPPALLPDSMPRWSLHPCCLATPLPRKFN